ncbi:hypothetical protein [Haloterrigena sp. H1]|uniref:hypothetical protein n=1 Tax=Haloterrigena sp. H1 TaxID=2552943 RepID=UPI0014860B50|nr:hypothetical protein [Haloterrigena sp. H1]
MLETGAQNRAAVAGSASRALREAHDPGKGRQLTETHRERTKARRYAPRKDERPMAVSQ